MNASQSDTDRTPPAPESWAAALDPRLVALLEQHQARAETVDPWTARFHAVPVAEGCFNKPRTNLLLQRSGMESGATVYVDGDLAYHGPDRTVNTILAGPCRRNWRRLRLPPLPGTVNEAICSALGLLGSPLAALARRVVQVRARTLAEAAATGVLDAVGEPVTGEMAGKAYAESFRQGLARQLAVLPTRSTLPRSALLWGRAGCGLDHLMLAAVHPLLEARMVTQVFRVSAAGLAAGCIFAQEVDAALMRLVEEAADRDGSLLLVRDLDACLTGSPISHCLLAGALDRGLRMFATVRSETALARLRDDEATARRVVAVYVPPPETAQTIDVLKHLAEAGQIEVSETAIETAVRITDGQRAAQPAAAVGLLGAALAEAAWAGRSQLDPDDVIAVMQSQWPE
ncbi:MAG TPA: hypothetical protein VMY37_17715 [Thermoguttaceae bacterium]|nr:hypothetical protein [Thermoguttaceae bacterium]